MKTEKEKSHDRAPGMVQTSIAIPKTLLDRLGSEAKRQRRSRNNLIQILLEDAVISYETQKEKPLLLAAETTAGYGKKP